MSQNVRNSARFAGLMAVLGVAVIEIDKQSLITFANPALSQLTGHSLDDLIGAHISLIQDAHSPTHSRDIPDASNKGPKGLVGLKHKDGHVLQVKVRAVKVDLPPGDPPIRIGTVIPV